MSATAGASHPGPTPPPDDPHARPDGTRAGPDAHADGAGTARQELAARQAELVASLVAGAPGPDGFDADDLAVARRALLRKRAGEVRHGWPLLAAAYGTRWADRFAAWADGRPPAGALRDGWDLARELAAGGALPDGAAAELAAREATTRYDGRSAPRPRRLPAVRRVGRAVAIGAFGRVRILSR